MIAPPPGNHTPVNCLSSDPSACPQPRILALPDAARRRGLQPCEALSARGARRSHRPRHCFRVRALSTSLPTPFCWDGGRIATCGLGWAKLHRGERLGQERVVARGWPHSPRVAGVRSVSVQSANSRTPSTCAPRFLGHEWRRALLRWRKILRSLLRFHFACDGLPIECHSGERTARSSPNHCQTATRGKQFAGETVTLHHQLQCVRSCTGAGRSRLGWPSLVQPCAPLREPGQLPQAQPLWHATAHAVCT